MHSEEKIKAEKKAVAREAMDFLQDDITIGVGSGTTMAYFIKYLAKSLNSNELRNIQGVPTSLSVQNLMREKCIPIKDLKKGEIDVAIDGLDSIIPSQNIVIKGGGGACLQEKIVDYAADKLILIGDARKLNREFPVPIEVLPSAMEIIRPQIDQIGGKIQTRKAEKKLGPVISDNGNIISDIKFPKKRIVPSLENKLKSIPGVLETGLFTRDATILISLENGEEIREITI